MRAQGVSWNLGVPAHLVFSKPKASRIRIQVDNEHHAEDLLAFLRKNGCIALRAGERALAVHAPACRTDRAERRKLRVCLSTWQATHPDAETTLAD